MYINTWSSIANYYLMRDNTKSLRMKKLLILFWIICFSNHYLTAQEYSKEFRVIGQDEINMSRYSNDSAAEAVILFDIGESKFIDTRDGYDILFTRTKRIKVLSPYGIKYAEVSIPFYADGSGKTESVESIEAYSYSNDNGKLTKTVLDHRHDNGRAFGDQVRQGSFRTWHHINLASACNAGGLSNLWSRDPDRRDAVTSIQIKPPGKPFIALDLDILFARVYYRISANSIVYNVPGEGEWREASDTIYLRENGDCGSTHCSWVRYPNNRGE